MGKQPDPFNKKRDWLNSLSLKRKKTDITKLENYKKYAGAIKSCSVCAAVCTTKDWHRNACVCPECGGHHTIPAYERLYFLLDSGTFEELAMPEITENPLDFPAYTEKKELLKEKTGLYEAVVCAKGEIYGHKAVFAVLDSRFLMGSMGTYLGEAVTAAVEHAGSNGLPLIIFSASGGARMQEGIYSLMQMAKTSAAIAEFSAGGGLFVSCLTHPTTGGVTASFAMLGDITLAEPGALIGFAGPRVIEQTIRQKLPKGFQRSEYLLEHGFVDQVVPRQKMRNVLCTLLKVHAKEANCFVART